MKLKSKLIATIVSICAAIAVMGVGVWAATSNFTVSVTNVVNFSVTNLAGTIKVTGAATVNDVAQDENYTNKLADTLLYNSADHGTGDPITTDIAVAGTVKYDGAGLFDNEDGTKTIDNTTTKATLTYTFVYDAPEGTTGAGVTLVTITPGDNLPSLGSVSGATIKCQYKAGSGTLTDLANGAEVQLYAPAGTDITIAISCTYENANLISVNAEGSFDFDIKFESAASAGSATLIG